MAREENTMEAKRPVLSVRGSELASVLYHDDALVALNKPAGLSLATPRQQPQAAVRRLLDSLPREMMAAEGLSEERLWLVHRLDVGTSGLVLLAKTREAHRALSCGLSERKIAKVYLALVWGHPHPRCGSFEWPIGPDRKDRRRMKVDLAGRPATSGFRTLAVAPHVSLLELRPETGRTHQLRVHLSHAGHWIVGDDFYGGPRQRGVRDARMRDLLSPTHSLLHAWRMHLPEVILGRELVITAPIPEDFSRILHGLGMPDSLLA